MSSETQYLEKIAPACLRSIFMVLVLQCLPSSNLVKTKYFETFLMPSPSANVTVLSLNAKDNCIILPNHEPMVTKTTNQIVHSNRLIDLKLVQAGPSTEDICREKVASLLHFKDDTELVNYLTANPFIDIATSQSFNSPLPSEPYIGNPPLYLSSQNRHTIRAKFISYVDGSIYAAVQNNNLIMNKSSGGMGYTNDLPTLMVRGYFTNISSTKLIEALIQIGAFNGSNFLDKTTEELIAEIQDKKVMTIEQIEGLNLIQFIKYLKKELSTTLQTVDDILLYSLRPKENDLLFSTLQTNDVGKIWELLYDKQLLYFKWQICITSDTNFKTTLIANHKVLSSQRAKFREEVLNGNQIIVLTPINRKNIQLLGRR